MPGLLAALLATIGALGLIVVAFAWVLRSLSGPTGDLADETTVLSSIPRPDGRSMAVTYVLSHANSGLVSVRTTLVAHPPFPIAGEPLQSAPTDVIAIEANEPVFLAAGQTLARARMRADALLPTRWLADGRLEVCPARESKLLMFRSATGDGLHEVAVMCRAQDNP